MTDDQYQRLVKAMPQVHATSSEFKKRRVMEGMYYRYHHQAGVRLRAKYRPR